MRGVPGNDGKREKDTKMKEKILEIILSVCALDETADENTELSALSLDSLSFISALVKLEVEFGIEFDLEELNMEKWNTVGDIINKIEEKVNDKE